MTVLIVSADDPQPSMGLVIRLLTPGRLPYQGLVAQV